MSSPSTDVTIVGAGLVGLATARALIRSRITDSVRVVEKEPHPALHQSTHNSGVLHAGLAYAPGSTKARLARDGIRRMTEYCRHHGIAHEICGKLVVAVEETEMPLLGALLDRGRANGLTGLRWLNPAEAAEIEPHVRCVGALHVPEEGIVSFSGVAEALVGELRQSGVDLVAGAELHGAVREHGTWRLATEAGEFTSTVFVNCAGLHADRVATRAGARPEARILPFRGEYLRVRPEHSHLVRHLIYPVPRPGFPFLGVHLTRRVDGGVECGPNAVLAFAREGYTRSAVDLRDLAEALVFPGLWRFVARHRRMVGRELLQSLDRTRLVRALQRLVPELEGRALQPGGSGVRAQAVLPSGDFVHDFLWVEAPGAIHVLNAPSPAATASLAIGRVIAARVGRALRSLRGSKAQG